MTRRAIYALGVAVLTGRAMANTYFISPLGNNSNDGLTEATAWKTLSRASAQTYAPGDSLLLQGGATFSGTLTLGANQRGLTVSSFGTGKATIAAAASRAIRIENTSEVTIENLVVRGGWNYQTQSGNSATGIELAASQAGGPRWAQILIRNVEAFGFRDAGIGISCTTPVNSKRGFDGVTIENCSVHDNGAAGISMWGPFSATSQSYSHKNLTIRGCRVWNNRGISSAASHSGSGIVVSDVDTALIEHCVAFNNGELCASPGGGPVGIWCWDAKRVTIQKCESYGNKSQTIDGGGFDLDGGCTECVLQYNYSHGNVGAGYLLAQFGGARPFHSNTVRFNISENDGRRNGYGGIVLWDGNGDLETTHVYNNTVFVGPAPEDLPCAIGVISSAPDVIVRNNVFMVTSGLPLIKVSGAQNSLIMQGNLYWASEGTVLIDWNGASFASIEAWCASTGFEMLNGQPAFVFGDPQFSSPGAGITLDDTGLLRSFVAYRPGPASAARKSGLDLKSLFGIDPGPTDFLGKSIPVNRSFDKGAISYRPPRQDDAPVRGGKSP